MVISPKIRGFICTTAHPAGCYQEVLSQLNYVQSNPSIKGPKNVLIIGASTGYGLASRIVGLGAGAKTLGVSYERPAEDEKRTASPGWYNTAAVEELAKEKGIYAKSINGDAFSDEIKNKTAQLIRQDMGTVDLVIYSLASPRRTDPATGHTYSSVLKPIGQAFTSKTVDPFQGEVKEITIEPATQDQIDQTVKVMGGEDWARWIDFLLDENLLAQDVITVAYSYIGPQLTHAIYKEGTIGKAKEHLHQTAQELTQRLAPLNGRAVISVNKALVTQASAAIPVVPLYISLLYSLMKQKGTHEGCIEQIYRLFKDHLYVRNVNQIDALIRLDDLEMEDDIQARINDLWPTITSENLPTSTDIKGYCNDFYRLFGFNNSHVDYSRDTDINVKIDSIKD